MSKKKCAKVAMLGFALLCQAKVLCVGGRGASFHLPAIFKLGLHDYFKTMLCR